jgi:hypothetical protein
MAGLWPTELAALACVEGRTAAQQIIPSLFVDERT